MPTARQLLRQVITLLLIAALWSGLFLMLLGATRSSNVAFVAERGTPVKSATVTGGAARKTPTVAATSTATKSSTAPTFSANAVATRTATIAANTPIPEPITATVAPTSAVTTSISFQRDVLPIFTQICVKCHGGEKTQHGLVLKTYDDVMQGSDNGPVVLPGDPNNSVLVDMVVKGKMPKNGPKLLPRQIQAIIAWINAGAPNN
jgi:mono/diheme cytochrome c family protein